jgi:hypothetical protein
LSGSGAIDCVFLVLLFCHYLVNRETTIGYNRYEMNIIKFRQILFLGIFVFMGVTFFIPDAFPKDVKNLSESFLGMIFFGFVVALSFMPLIFLPVGVSIDNYSKQLEIKSGLSAASVLCGRKQNQNFYYKAFWRLYLLLPVFDKEVIKYHS